MPRFSPDILRPLWERALESEVGLEIETNDPKALRQELLIARTEMEDGHIFNSVMSFCPEGIDAVWLIRKDAEIPDA